MLLKSFIFFSIILKGFMTYFFELFDVDVYRINKFIIWMFNIELFGYMISI